MKLSTSFLSAPTRIKEINKLNTDYIHCDIMDGSFVKNLTKFFSLLEDNIKDINHPLDVHLMVENIMPYISLYSTLNPMYMTFHLEIGNTSEIISAIKNHNIKVGISIKPNTNIEEIIPFLDKIDLVLVMSVEPGLGGQMFLKSSIEKIQFLKQYREKNNLNYVIEVDGGINDETVDYCRDADIIVVGSFITKEIDMNYQIEKLKM